ncbi:hypothetical protein [Kitasatospora sp. NPDC093558]|uniref:hypothetical protein n=1 Tax=Kitasatospora sp. NPDC093558 TaxID=3155201 RepID=UPI00341D885F
MSSTTITPISSHELDLLRALKSRAAGGGLSAEAVVLAQGRLQVPSGWPAGLPRRSDGGDCFRNAWRIALKPAGLVYVEGFVLGEGGVVTRRAWCADEDGRALDPTWRDGRALAYVGVGMAAAWVAAVQQRTCTRTRFPGVLDAAVQHTRDADRVFTYGVPATALIPLGRELPPRPEDADHCDA